MKTILLLSCILIHPLFVDAQEKVTSYLYNLDSIGTADNALYTVSATPAENGYDVVLHRKKEKTLFAQGRSLDLQGLDKVGQWEFHFVDGGLQSKGSYDGQGLLTGEWKNYSVTGELFSEGQYVDGKKEGEWKWYFKNGTASSVEQFEQDEMKSYKFFDERGKKQRKSKYWTEASFKGGMEGLYQWLSDNIEYPEMARNLGIQGKVHIQFVVEPNGEISNAFVKKKVSKSLDKAALDIIKKMPNWSPGYSHNQAVRSYFTLPVSFKIPNQRQY